MAASVTVEKDSCQLNRQRAYIGLELFQGEDFREGGNWSDFDPFELGQTQIG